MLDSKIAKPAYSCSCKVQQKLDAMIMESVTNTLLDNRIPLGIADKLARQVVKHTELSTFYGIIAQDIKDQRFPKQRILDRTIVYMFETLYHSLNAQNSKQDETSPNDFFNLVPRGECLDLFLQLVKEYCMGGAEIEKHTHKMGPMIEAFRTDDIIHWPELYKSDEFKSYLLGMLSLILTRLRKDQKPIPALENKMPVKYQPYRINAFLNQACILWQSKQAERDKNS